MKVKGHYLFIAFVLMIQLCKSDDKTTDSVNPTSTDEDFNNRSVTPDGNDYANYTNSAEEYPEEEEPEKSLQHLEDQIKYFLKSMFGRVFNFFVGAKLPKKASTLCLLNLVKVYFGFNNLEPWAFQLMDSSGKLSGGLLEGTSSALGDYDECLDVIIGGSKPGRRIYTGSYCMLEIKPPGPIISALKEYQINRGKGNISLATSKTFLGFFRKVRTNPEHVMFRLGICVPSRCSAYDIQDIVNTVTTNLDVDVLVKRCETKVPHKFKPWEIIITLFLCNIIALSLVGTLVEVFDNQIGCIGDGSSAMEPGPDALKLQNRWRRSKLFEILTKFSVCNSTQKLLVCTKEGDALDVVRGIKVLTVIFAIYTHTYALPHRLHLYRFRDTLNFSKFIDEVLFGTIANASVGVDTFFFLAGFLFIYYRWRLLNKPKIIQYVVKFVSIYYLRMLALQVLVIFIFALFPIFGSGPLWQEFVEEPLDNCAKSWWMNVLFIQNFMGPYDSCLYHTWILAVMMQLFVITALIVGTFHWKPLVGISITSAIIVLAAIAVAIVTVLEDFPATFTIYFYDYRTSIKYWKYLYVQAYNHIGPFCIGMLSAYFIAEQPALKLRKPIVLSLWIASCLTFCGIIFGLYHYRENSDMDRGLAVLYSALHRPAWGLAIGWIVYACATGYGGFVNKILSWKAFIPVERLCYLAYLVHIPIMYFHGGIQRERMYMGHYNQVMCFFSYTVASFMVSFLCYLLFQYPFETIESYIFGKPKQNSWQEERASSSTESLKTQNSEKQIIPENAKVLYSRYEKNIQNILFSEVN